MTKAVPLQSRRRSRKVVSGAAPSLVIDVDEETRVHSVDVATYSLARDYPELSSQKTLTQRQKIAFGVTAGLLVILAIPFTIGVLQLVAGFLTLLYAAAVCYRLRALQLGLRGASIIRITDEEARAVDPATLPVYTVLVPAYKEPEVIAAVLANLGQLDYPRDRLEILILLEEDDPETLEAVQLADPPPHVRVVIVPSGEAQTKPRACNYGLLFSTGDLVTIYDAEDEPEPLQLRKTAIAFSRLPHSVACIQARLAYFNADQNVITRWFTAEYLTWFNHFLPGLAAMGSPIPLGGTSNHVRGDVLRQVGAWDPYNVTEDADLGIRLARMGYEVQNLDSVTLEEANSDFINWVKQRSRWYKGYLLTWLVHMREPVKTYRAIGWRGMAGLNLFVGGTPVLAALNPIFWFMAILWFGFHPHLITAVFAGALYFLAMGVWIFGNLAMVYMGFVSIKAVDRPELLLSVFAVPVYWVMMALAAIKAIVQLVVTPTLWEKTTHGLAHSPVSAGPVGGPTS